MSKFLFRVDDCGWTPDKQPDHHLDYFRRWRSRTNVNGVVYYAFIPSTLGELKLKWLHENLQKNERLAVHGYDHDLEGDITREKMREAREKLFGTSVYVPPSHDYDRDLLKKWSSVGGKYLIGGFDHYIPDSINKPRPEKYSRVWHVPVHEPFYSFTEPQECQKRIQNASGTGYVLTRHLTWDFSRMDKTDQLHKIGQATEYVSLQDYLEVQA